MGREESLFRVIRSLGSIHYYSGGICYSKLFTWCFLDFEGFLAPFLDGETPW